MSEFPKLLLAGQAPEGALTWKKKSPKVPHRLQSEAGYSTTEILVVVCVLGILAMVGIPAIIGGFNSSKKTTASSNLELFNAAVRRYSTAVAEISTADDSGNSDETAIITELKVRGSADSRPGSPYLADHLKINFSSSTADYRAKWNGYEFQLLEPGTSGSGVNLLKLQ